MGRFCHLTDAFLGPESVHFSVCLFTPHFLRLPELSLTWTTCLDFRPCLWPPARSHRPPTSHLWESATSAWEMAKDFIILSISVWSFTLREWHQISNGVALRKKVSTLQDLLSRVAQPARGWENFSALMFLGLTHLSHVTLGLDLLSCPKEVQCLLSQELGQLSNLC